MTGASIIHATVPHTINVIVHVAFGTAALAAGVVPIVTSKGGPVHRRFGRYFLACLAVVVLTAAIGVFAFEFRAFLGIITLLASYDAYSGYRALRIRTTGPRPRDTVVAVSALLMAAVFLAYLHVIRMPWAPVVIYSTLGALVFVASYDLVRLAFPTRWFARLWLYEHLAKMLAAYTAVVSAFAGTVLSSWQPYSQILPSAFGTCAMLGFGIHASRRFARGVVVAHAH